MNVTKIKLTLFVIAVIATASLSSYTLLPATTRYKCMIQMSNYTGEGAYVVISLINPKGEYEKTVYIQGDDKDWYDDIKKWWSFYSKDKVTLDGITSASILGGQRSMFTIELDNAKIDAGYHLRFESAVEDKGYHEKDVEFALTKANIATGKAEGSGFIRYVRITPN